VTICYCFGLFMANGYCRLFLLVVKIETMMCLYYLNQLYYYCLDYLECKCR